MTKKMIAIPIELLEQFERGNVLLFIGEQILSDVAGRATIDQLTAELVARTQIDHEEELDFPALAQLYQDQQNRHSLVQFVCERLEAPEHKPQPVHHLIARLSACRIIVTTCLDQRLEEALTAAGRPFDLIIGGVDVAFEDAQKTQLYKLRGSVERSQSLVLTEDDYEAFFEDQSSISVALQGYLARKTILFVGYDLADPYFKRLYFKVTASLDGYARRSYAFGGALAPRVTRWCQRHGIHVVEVNAAAFLEALANQLAQRAQPGSTVSQPLVPMAPEPLPAQPYKLLDYYEAADEAMFFGRRAETEMLCAQINAHRLVLLYGLSGTGKTSLLSAGVVPRLARAEPPYRTIYVRALEDPSQVIRRTVRRLLPSPELLENGSLVSFIDVATKALGCTLLIVLDQFEEFFIRLSPQSRAAFITELGELYDANDVPVKMVLSLREEWLAALSEIEQRIPDVYRNRFRLLPLSRDQARQAITGPVERLGVRYESALVERLLNDLTGQDVSVMPPQLQLVCSALYRELGFGDLMVILATYERMGGARGVLYRYLEEELARLSPATRALARSILEALVSSQQTKRVATRSELAREIPAVEASLDEVLNKLIDARLVRSLQSSALDEPTYELAHEYLIDQITTSPEVRQRKEAEELLRQGIDSWQRFGTLLSEDTLALIDERQQLLQPMSLEGTRLLALSHARHRRRSEWILRGVMGGLLGGALGGALGQLAEQFLATAPQNQPQPLAQIGGMSLVAAVVGALLGLGITFGSVLPRNRTMAAVLGGGLVGLLLGWVIDIVFTLRAPVQPIAWLVSGALYGAGIAASILLGTRVRNPLLKLLTWLLLGASIGGFFSLMTGPAVITPRLPVITASITAGIGLAGVRRYRRSKVIAQGSPVAARPHQDISP